MIVAAGRIGVVLAAGLVLQGCSEGGRLMNLSSASTTPDEFAILPSRGLEIPDDLAALPAPVPGGSDLARVDAIGAGVRALGGDIAVVDIDHHGLHLQDFCGLSLARGCNRARDHINRRSFT